MSERTRILLARRIGRMSGASGKKRIAYAIGNVILMALSVVFVLCVKWSWEFMTGNNFIAGLLCLILSIAAALFSFAEGFIAQFALVFISGIGIRTDGPEHRSANTAALIIALLTTLGLIAAGIFFVLAF